MPRGSNRKDVPAAAGTEWIDYDCPVHDWEYWEERFGGAFSRELRSEISRGMADLSNYRKVYDATSRTQIGQRLDAKQIIRELEKTIKSGKYPGPEIERFAVLHSLDLASASPSEKAKHVLDGFLTASEDYLCERPEPHNLFTRAFFEMFHRHGMNMSLGSTGTLYGEEGMSAEARATAAPESPFVEFIRLILEESGNSSARYCARIRKRIQRCPICSKL